MSERFAYRGTRVSSVGRVEDMDREEIARLRASNEAMRDWLSTVIAPPFELTGDEPCTQPEADPEDWYDNFGMLRREDGTRVPVSMTPQRRRAEAERLCAGCPSKSTCLESALENRNQYGVWGGMTEEDRRLLYRARRHGGRTA